MLFSKQQTLAGKTHKGTFLVRPGKELPGHLNLENTRRPKLMLYNQDETPWMGTANLPSQITGELSDGTKVSLLGCLMLGIEQPIFPDRIVGGAHHLQSEEESITAIKFAIHDARFLHWRSVFEIPLPEEVDADTNFIMGNNATTLFESETTLGRVLAQYCWEVSPSCKFPPVEPERDFQGHVIISLKFPDSVLLEAAWRAAQKILYFLGTVSNKPVDMAQAAIFKEIEPNSPLEIFPLHYHLRFCGSLSGDVELEPIVKDRRSLVNLFARWIDLGENDEETEKLWEARQRYCTSCLAMGPFVGPDRLISAANLFDLLPDSATHTEVRLQPEFREAIEAARHIFKKLPKENDCYLIRERGLSDLGRLGHPTLRTKIRTRAQMVINHFAPDFDRIIEIADLSVKLRNRYVHGDDNGNEPSLNELVICTKTLEFIFVVSDLLDAGWSAECFRKRWAAFEFVHIYLNRYNNFFDQLE